MACRQLCQDFCRVRHGSSMSAETRVSKRYGYDLAVVVHLPGEASGALPDAMTGSAGALISRRRKTRKQFWTPAGVAVAVDGFYGWLVFVVQDATGTNAPPGCTMHSASQELDQSVLASVQSICSSEVRTTSSTGCECKLSALTVLCRPPRFNACLYDRMELTPAVDSVARVH
jgi:hypothetical protein